MNPMSKEEQRALIKAEIDEVLGTGLQKLNAAAQWVKVLVVGAFGLGVWVAGIQMNQTSANVAVVEMRGQLQRLQDAKENTGNNIAVMQNDISTIKQDVTAIKTALIK